MWSKKQYVSYAEHHAAFLRDKRYRARAKRLVREIMPDGVVRIEFFSKSGNFCGGMPRTLAERFILAAMRRWKL